MEALRNASADGGLAKFALLWACSAEVVNVMSSPKVAVALASALSSGALASDAF